MSLEAPDPAWTPLAPFYEALGTRSFLEADADRVRVRYFADAEGRTRARARFGPGAEGPPGHVHGGALAALLDECMGMAALATGRVCVAARLEVDFRAMLPLGEAVTVETEVGDATRRKVPVRGRVVYGGAVVAEATGLFVEIGSEGMGAAAERAGR